MKKFRQLIQAMPLNEQAFTSKKSTWIKFMKGRSRVPDILTRIFDGKDEVQISRKDLFYLAKQDDLGYFIVATILWGYPRGMRGNHFQSLMSQIEELNIALIEASNGITDWLKHYDKIKKIDGVGLSTYSKFLYFLEAKIEGSNALILDNRISDTINKGVFKEFHSMGHVSYNNAVSKYLEYLKIIDKISHDLNADSGNVEMFIFEFGQNLKIDEGI